MEALPVARRVLQLKVDARNIGGTTTGIYPNVDVGVGEFSQVNARGIVLSDGENALWVRRNLDAAQ